MGHDRTGQARVDWGWSGGCRAGFWQWYEFESPPAAHLLTHSLTQLKCGPPRFSAACLRMPYGASLWVLPASSCVHTDCGLEERRDLDATDGVEWGGLGLDLHLTRSLFLPCRTAVEL